LFDDINQSAMDQRQKYNEVIVQQPIITVCTKNGNELESKNKNNDQLDVCQPNNMNIQKMKRYSKLDQINSFSLNNGKPIDVVIPANVENPTTMICLKDNLKIKKSKNKKQDDLITIGGDKMLMDGLDDVGLVNVPTQGIVQSNKEHNQGFNITNDQQITGLRRSDRLKNKKIKCYSDLIDDVDNLNEQIMVNLDKINNTEDINRSPSKVNKICLGKSAIEKHHIETKHDIDWENVELLWSDSNPHKLLIKESLMIKAYEPELNRNTHSIPLYIYPNGIDRKFLPRYMSFQK
jgi:hypothetical protein